MIGWLLAGVAAWVALAVGMAVVVGRSITTADEAQDVYSDDLTALVQPESWSQSACDEAFALLVPSFVTEDTFHLDAAINRRADGGCCL